MTPDERRGLAEQLKANPLFAILMDKLEQVAVSRMYAADTDAKRLEAQAYARAAKNFRLDCDAELRNTQTRSAAPV